MKALYGWTTLSLFLLSSFSFAGPIPGKDFFEKYKGTYKIETANGVAPHDPASAEATISLKEKEGKMMLPYCSEDEFCDLGLYIVPLDSAKIDLKSSTKDLEEFTMEFADGPDVFHFEWKISPTHITVRNLEYLWPSGAESPIEFVLKR